ncbi:DUF2334 domain-containing protein [Dictyoglomus thermophilum]|uniref:DUF2334 domain-containing protein n=1 Tax=Dictyoglomus thermophilum TaxID=14 RepID=A0A7V3ZIE7_DICTH|nr:DUF2334 domain-containing protein [Dictyoglomus thermophilum]TYT23473.1 DUF2334 domain-containing protein [Dictyoglomus thermophilum]
MMYKIFLIFLAFLTLFSPAFSENQKRVLIVYDSISRIGENYPIEELLKEYLTHYDVETGSCESENIVDPSDYDLTIYLGFQRKILSDKFLKNISKSKKLIWVEENIEQFANFIGCKDFRFEGIKYNFIEIIYRNYILSVSPEIPFYIVRPKEAEVISYLSDGHYKFPWVFKKNNIYYFGRLDFRDSSGIVFLDLLHDILGINHSVYKKAIIVLDNVNSLTSAEFLMEKVQSLCCYEVPHLLVVYPSIRKDNKTYYLKDNPKLLEILRQIEESGGFIIQGTYYDKDFSYKINQDLNLLASYGIFPVAFKFYDISDKSKYVDPGKYFNILLYDDLIITKKLYTLLYPINLGEFNPKDPKNLISILEKARNMLALRDAIVGISIPVYVNVKEIEKLVINLKKLGYDFMDFSKEPYHVENENLIIRNKEGKKYILSKVPLYEKTPVEKFFDKFIEYLRVILVFAVTSFILIIIWLIKNRHKLYEKDEKR